VVLLDLSLPDSDGLDTFRSVVAQAPRVPIVVLTAQDDESLALKALQEGAQDYLIKGHGETHTLVRAIRYAIERNRIQDALEKANQDLKRTVERLEEANQKILEQQKSVIQEERLKVLLQMAGATAHEINQPLMGLFADIESVRRNKDNPEEVAQHLDRAEKCGDRIAHIVKKIQNIRHDDTIPYYGQTRIIDLDQKLNVLYLEDSDEDFEKVNTILKDHTNVALSRVRNLEEASQVLEENRFDLILLEYFLPEGNGFDFMKALDKKGLEIPVIVITRRGDEMIASQVIQAGAYDYLPKERLTHASLFQSIANSMEKARLKKEIKRAQQKIAEMSRPVDQGS